MKTERPSVKSGPLHSEVCRNILLQNVILWIALIYASTSLFNHVHHSVILVYYIRVISLYAKLYGNYQHFPLNSKQQHFDDHVIKIWAKFCKNMYMYIIYVYNYNMKSNIYLYSHGIFYLKYKQSFLITICTWFVKIKQNI